MKSSQLHVPPASYAALNILLTVVLFLGMFPGNGCAGPVSEHLTYSLSWSGVPVGTSTQEISDDGRQRRIVATARSNAWLSLFHHVDDRIESSYDRSGPVFPGNVLSYRMQIHEGIHRRDREILFYRQEGKASYNDRLNGERGTVPIPADVYDIYGSFYRIRYLPLEPGKPLSVKVLDGREVRRIEVEVLGRETLKTMLGRVETIKVRPLVMAEGVFEGKRGVTIWLTDDQRRIPVKVQTGVTVGSVTATLVEMR